MSGLIATIATCIGAVCACAAVAVNEVRNRNAR